MVVSKMDDRFEDVREGQKKDNMLRAWGDEEGGADVILTQAQVEHEEVTNLEEETSFIAPVVRPEPSSHTGTLKNKVKRTKKRPPKQKQGSPDHAMTFLSSPAISSPTSSKGKEDEKDSEPVSLPARADTPASISSHHPSIGEMSLDGSRSVTSQSDSRSYRERLKDRIQSVRDQASSAIVERSRLKHRLRSQAVTSRFDEILHEEEEQVEAALVKHEHVRDKWKSAAKAIGQLPKEQDCYDFFTRVWESPKKEAEPAPPSLPQVNGEESTEEQAKLLTADYLGLKDDWELIETKSPTCIDPEEVKSTEESLYFYPNNQPVPLDVKMSDNCHPRYPEEEGLYVGTSLPVSNCCRNRLEQRIVASGDMKWFGEDGEIISIPDPRSSVMYRPPMLEEICPLLEAEYQPAVPHKIASEQPLQPFIVDHKCILDLEILSVSFIHHPLFSTEHVLAHRLIDLYQKYRQRVEFNNERLLRARLEALRRARNGLRTSLEKKSPPPQEQTDRLKKYMFDIQEVRQSLHTQCRHDRKLITNVLETWRHVKQTREEQGYTNTSLQLRIYVQHCDPETDHRMWEELIETELQEMEDEKLEDYNRQCEEHQSKLTIWKNQNRHLHEAHKQRQRASEESIEPDEESEGDEDEPPPLSEKPKPPSPINRNALRVQLIEELQECFRPPGEPHISLELTHSGRTDPDPDDAREHQRRIAQKKSTLTARIVYNNQEVCQTRAEPLSSCFEVMFREMISICIAEWPESLKVELNEEGGGSFGKHLIAEVYVPIPSSTTIMEGLPHDKLEFSNTDVLTYNHTGVGSGRCMNIIPKSTDNVNQRTCLYTTGVLTCRAGWALEERNGKILAPPDEYWSKLRRSSTDLTDIINLREGSVDLTKLKQWAENSTLDPNDPSNSTFFHYIKTASVGLESDPTYFRLDPLQSEFDFCKSEDLEKNPRLRLLYLRDRGEPEFRGVRQVPLREKEIPEDVFKAYEHRLSNSELEIDSASSDPLDLHRAWGQRFLQEIRQRILKQCKLARQHRKLEDVVAEDQVPDIGTLGLTFMQWFRPKRPLRPARKERKKVTVQSLGGQDVKLIVNVVRAFDVPVRKDTDTVVLTPSAVNQGQKFATVPVRPFLEVTFQGVSSRTTTADGNNPTWNQDLQLPLRPPSGDFTPGNLQEIQDALHLHLFDEIVVDLLEDDRVRDTNIHQRLERNWLGSLRIPFITLYHNSRIEGTFKLYSPPVLIGYEREPQHRQFSGFTNEAQSFLPLQDSTFLTLFITVQPALNPPEPFKERLECGEPAYLEEHLQNWEQQVVSQFPHRRPKTLVVDVSGKSICVTRFIRSIAPPVISELEGTNANMAARYVCMIPMVAGSVLFPGLFDIWLSSDQVLTLLSGDSEDHAVLLCCYLLHLKRKVWVLLGAGIPHGPTAYVLEQCSDNRFCLWDPASGQCYNIRNTFCPLQKVFCLINDENIWANVQNEELQNMRFDVSRRSDWWPAFGRTVNAPTVSIQPSALEYNQTSTSAVQLLQDKIEKHLRDNLMKWRRTSRTLWNRYCVAILRKLLPALEQETWCLESSGSVDHIHELQHILGSHKMCGFPINVPYTNMAAITECVRATGVHFCQSPEVEFALAVYIHPYPNNVLSVWVYVASLVRRR